MSLRVSYFPSPLRDTYQKEAPSPLCTLATEVILHIISSLPPLAICRLACCSHRYRDIIKNYSVSIWSHVIACKISRFCDPSQHPLQKFQTFKKEMFKFDKETNAGVFSLPVSPGKEIIAACFVNNTLYYASSKKIYAWNIDTFAKEKTRKVHAGHHLVPHTLRASADKKSLIWGYEEGEIHRRNIEKKSQVISEKAKEVIGLIVEEDLIFSCHRDGKICAWNNQTLTLQKILHPAKGPSVSFFFFSPNKEMLFIAYPNSFCAVRMRDCKPLFKLNNNINFPNFSLKRNELFVLSEQQIVVFAFDGETLTQKASFGADCLLSCYTFSSNEQFIYSGGKDGKVRVWDVDTGVCLQEFQTKRLRVESLAISSGCVLVSSEDKFLLSFDMSGGLDIFDLEDPSAPPKFLPLGEDNVYPSFFPLTQSSNGRFIAVRYGNQVKVVDLKNAFPGETFPS